MPNVERLLMLSSMTVAAVFAGIAEVRARVGVASATNGDPTGKAPTQSERVLRVGTDIQAGEVITTHHNDRIDLLFVDGTSLTASPDSQFRVDNFLSAPGKQSELALSLMRGVVRVVGSHDARVVVNTPAAGVALQGGIGLLDVRAEHTKAELLAGRRMTVSANGQLRNVDRAGSQVVTRLGAAPGVPEPTPATELSRELASLEQITGDTSYAGSQIGGALANPPQTLPPNTPANTVEQALSNAEQQHSVQETKPTR
jgi:hypothetical protein